MHNIRYPVWAFINSRNLKFSFKYQLIPHKLGFSHVWLWLVCMSGHFLMWQLRTSTHFVNSYELILAFCLRHLVIALLFKFMRYLKRALKAYLCWWIMNAFGHIYLFIVSPCRFLIVLDSLQFYLSDVSKVREKTTCT